MDNSNDDASTGTSGLSEWIQQYINQGIAKPTQISKTFDPTDELTALSASPL